MADTTKRTDPLSRTEIARAALEMVDRDGVDQFSMRRLARELGVTTMAVYHHFENKAEILQAAADQVWIEVVTATPRVDDPVERIIQQYLTARRVFHEHADLTPYAFASPTTDDAIHIMALGVSTMFEQAGLAGDDVAHAYFTMATYTFGSGLLHAERSMLDRHIRRPVSDIGGLATDSLPTDVPASYGVVRDAMGSDPDLVRFERGLRSIMAGLLAEAGVDRPAVDEPSAG